MNRNLIMKQCSATLMIAFKDYLYQAKVFRFTKSVENTLLPVHVAGRSWRPFSSLIALWPAGPAGPAGPTGPGPWYTVNVYGLPGTSGTQPFEILSQPYWKEKQQLALITFTVFHLDLIPRSVNVVLNDSESRKKVKIIWLEHSSMGLNWGKIVKI